MTADARRVTLGRIAGVYGVKGWVRVHSECSPPEAILDYRPWMIGGQAQRVLQSKVQGNGILVLLADAEGQASTDRDQAAAWVGKPIEVLRSQLPPPKGDAVYLIDLPGMAVVSVEGTALGVVQAVASNGAQPVLVLQYTDAAGEALERLIPFVRGPIVDSVDMQGGVIRVHWQPEW